MYIFDLESMKEPIVTHCGHSFDKKFIDDWLKNEKVCPTCREYLDQECYFSNYQMKNMAEFCINLKNNIPSLIID